MSQILLIDDEPTLLKMYSTKLELEGYSVVTATNGNDGYKIAKQIHPDIILLDLVMKGGDGFETLKALKDDVDTKHIPVIILTNITSNKDKHETEKLGANGYFIKADMDPKDVVSIVKNVVRC